MAAMMKPEVPETAMGPAIPQDKGYLVEEIADGLYWVTEGSYQAMFLTTGEGVIVVDAPPSIGSKLLDAIAEVTDEPVTHVVYSHAHADHIGAAGLFPADAEYIAQADAAAHLAAIDADDPEREFPFGSFLGGGPVPLPTTTFTDSYTLEVGNQVLELRYDSTNHAPGNVFVYAPAQKVLMVVDLFFPGWVPFLNLALAQDVPGFVDAHELALEYDFDTLVAGHLGRLGTREDVETQLAYIMDVRANAAEALQTTDFMAIAGETGFINQWKLFGAYLDAVAQNCADLTLETWAGKLGGAEEFTKSHCFTMAEALRID
jgi:glyoxylase-like metal-dependent hydrolase (beta-lactamase superfamily II)